LSLSCSRIVGPKNVTSCYSGCYTREVSGPQTDAQGESKRKVNVFLAGDRTSHFEKKKAV
jgi:hypothetical protein